MLPAHRQLQQAMAALTAARGEQMVDGCFVTRGPDPGQTPELDAAGNVVATPPVTVYDGPCTLFDPRGAQLAGRTANDQAGVPNMRGVKLPHSADLRPGDLLTVTAAAFSPGLVGDVFVVLGEEERTYATHRRYLLRGSSWLSPEAGASTAPGS
ncbi:DUF6093 family protein [Geodermatophilus chilensis]|uniref:DUF6093 family protein n=1 Tax=Geodermatophilus chilensis TaxID=2035835 RepID=UPI001E5F54FA|nr:DUF6093 family protein [Geodermatophilus chilensis]